MTAESINVISVLYVNSLEHLILQFHKNRLFHYDSATFIEPYAPRVNPAVSKDDGRITVSRCAAFSALGFVALCIWGEGEKGVKEVGYRCGVGGG